MERNMRNGTGNGGVRRSVDRSRLPYLRSSGDRRGLYLVLIGFVFLATLVFTGVSIAQSYATQTSSALLRRETIARLAAANLETRLDALVTLGTALAGEQRLVEHVDAGEWADAVAVADQHRQALDGVNRILLTDPAGLMMADSPALGTAGQSFAYRDWYQGVSRNWQPYVSEVYKRAADPQINVIAVALPVRSPQGSVTAVLVLQVALDTMLAWTRELDAGSGVDVFFVDVGGKVAAHPRILPQSSIVTIGAASVLRRALSGESGVMETDDGITGARAVVAYAPVSKYGWAAAVSQPAAEAFAERSESMRIAAFACIPVLALQITWALLLMRAFSRALRSHSRHHLVLESIGDGMIATDRLGKVMTVNRAAEEMLGIQSAQMMGRDFADAFSAFDEKGRKLARDKRPLVRALRGEKSVEKLLLQGKGGKQFPASFTVTPVVVGGDVDGAVLVFRDITKEEELDRAKREFVSIASHQLLTPVSSSKGYLSMLLAGDLGDFSAEQKEFLKKLYQLNQRTVDLVDDLLNLSRVELGVLESIVEPIDMVAFLRAEVRTQEPQMLVKRISLEERFDPVLPQVIIPSRLVRIIVQNLLSNAVKYTPEKGSIRLELSYFTEGGPGVLFSIIDSGCGIPPKDRAHVFEKFYRAENAREMGIEGTGLGLYIVKSVVDALRGKIWFESTAGKGTAFHVRIPAKNPASAE